MGNFFKTLAAFFVLGGLILALLAHQKFSRDFNVTYILEAPVTLVVPKGFSAKSIENLLKTQGILKKNALFYWNLRLRGWGALLQSGEYQFQGTLSQNSIVQTLMTGDVVQHSLTIPEGLSSREIITLLNKSDVLTGPPLKKIHEGSMLAETYALRRGDSKKDFIERAQKDLDRFLDNLWQNRPTDFFLKSKYDIIILASIIEKETAIAVERPRIAAVFLNRLRLGMPLQTDPTVIYAVELKTGQNFKGALLQKHLSIDSPYNTYLHKGLPPGPICHVGGDSLRAVMNPLKTNELYFVADGSGGHIFSKTYKAHKTNHQKWRKIRNSY